MKNNIKDVLIISVIISTIVIYIVHNHKDTISMTTPSGNNFVLFSDDNNTNKTELLDNITNNMFKLRDYMVLNIDKYPKYTEYINQLSRNLGTKTHIQETDPASSYTSYTVNKGEEISFCIKNKQTKQLYDLNLMMYVAIHEMAHVACPELGHGELFKFIFKKLTEVAIEIGIYTKIPFYSNPHEYCGMNITSSII